MLELLGLPVRDLPALKTWGLDSMELFWGWPGEDRQLELARSAADFYVWLRQLVAESVAAPGRNLFKSLSEHGLSTPEMCSLGYFLLIAGQETTTQLISTTLFRLLQGSAPLELEGRRLRGRLQVHCQARADHRIICPHVAPGGRAGHPAWR